MNGTLARTLPTDGSLHATQCPAAAPDRSILDATATAQPALRLGACTPFRADATQAGQDQAMAGQDPDIANPPAPRTLSRMPSSPSPAWPMRALRTLAKWFRTLAGPSSLSPATGRSIVRIAFKGRALGFREFTAPHRAGDAGRQRLRVKTTGASTRIARLSRRVLP